MTLEEKEKLISLDGLGYFKTKQDIENDNKFVAKNKLGDGLKVSADGTVSVDAEGLTVDSELSDISTNSVQNKVIKGALDQKVDVVDGKGLSTNDYTNEDKTKLASIATGAEVNVQSDWNVTDTTSDAYILNKPTSLPADGGNADTVGGHTVNIDVPADAKFTDTVYDDTAIKADIEKKVDAVDGKGLSTNDYTTAEKTKLEGIADGATAVNEATVSGWGFTKNTGTYTKPETGIPASDLASDVIPTTLPASDVKAWAKADDKPTYTASEVGALANTVTHLSGDIAATEKGVANGVATLGSDGKIPSGQLPSYVDDVLEYAKKSDFPVNGESGKIYVDKTTNLTWRWSGSDYTEISPSLALGETSSTAYAGDKGKALADKLAGIAAGAEVNVQSDWNVTDTTSDAYIKNKPTIPSAVTESTVSGWGFTKNTGTYSKPSTGIPATDLSSAVQTSLGKADTALQSYTEKYTGTYSKPSGGIPATDLSSAVQTSLGKADTALQSYTEKYTGTYSKPSGGIPKTDLASAVQASLDKADTALQSYTEKYTGTYSKPSGGIPKTDLASAVQTSLGKADTALQSHQSLAGYATETWVTNKGYTTNTGTVTGIKMNGASKGTSGVVDLGTVITTVDTALSSTSTNPVQNKAIKAAFDNKADSAKLYTVSISASETWTTGTNCKYITKTVTGLTTTDNIIISPSLSSDAAAAKLQIDAYKLILSGNVVVSADNTVTIYCYGNTPTTALTLNILATY